MKSLPENPVSLSDAIASGAKTFREVGGEEAYFGAPAEASRAEGEEIYARLVEMIRTEVLEALGR